MTFAIFIPERHVNGLLLLHKVPERHPRRHVDRRRRLRPREIPEMLSHRVQVALHLLSQEGGAVPPAELELELALFDRVQRAQTDAVHEGRVALAKVDLETKM